MKLFRFPLLAACVFGFALGGCGQKGPLYLPKDQSSSTITVNNDANTQPFVSKGASAPERSK